MNQPAIDPKSWAGPPRPLVDRIRPLLPSLALALLITAALAANLPFGGWRTAVDVANSSDPLALLPALRFGLEPASITIARWLIVASLAAVTGTLTWLWRGGTPGFGLFAACTAFCLSLLIEFARWFKPGQLPDLHDPLIAAIVAPAVWRVLRFLPAQPVTPLPSRGPWRMRRRILFRFLYVMTSLSVASVIAIAVLEVQALALTPSAIARRMDTLPEGQSGFSETVTRIFARAFNGFGIGPWLHAANRLDHPIDLPLPTWSGAGTKHDGVLPPGRLRSVTTIEMFRQAIDSAAPGDVILLQPGVYRIKQSYITANRPATTNSPITVRAPVLGSVTLESELAEVFKVDAPHWHFENLVLKGVCADDNICDNGFHIVGHAEHTIIHNLRIEDFNAQIKINGENGQFPDNGRIEHSTLIGTHVRRTEASVTPIDLVAASGWVIQDNLIADFVKDRGNRVSYGAFAKGAGRGTIFTRNVVLCEWRLREPTSATVGLSFGGGATGQLLMRDLGRSGYEHADGVMTENLIAFCSDDGIYLNRSANAVIRHNTLIGTAGIDVRYPESIAQVDANVVDGAIRIRDDGMFWGDGNESESLNGMFLGRNPVRSLFEDPARLDLRWRHLPALVSTEPGVDLCGADWTALSPAGAFRDFRACGQPGTR